MQGEATLHDRIMERPGHWKHKRDQHIDQDNCKWVEHAGLPTVLRREADSSGVGPQREAGDQLSEDPNQPFGETKAHGPAHRHWICSRVFVTVLLGRHPHNAKEGLPATYLALKASRLTSRNSRHDRKRWRQTSWKDDPRGNRDNLGHERSLLMHQGDFKR